MRTKTFETAVRFGILSILMMQARSCAASAHPEPVVQVAVYNDAKVDPRVLRGAEAVGAEVFEEAGLKFRWLNCGRAEESAAEVESCTHIAFPMHLQLRILREPRKLPEFTFGLSYLDVDGIGCYSEVFVAHLDEMRRKTGQSESVILGHVMAHEVAHLLLGTNSHAENGIMKARWDVGELEEAARGELRFTRREAETMRRKVLLVWNNGNAVMARIADPAE